MLGESKNAYVSRKVAGFRKDYQRTHELEDNPSDPDEFRYASLEAKHAAEDWWDFTNGESAWPW